MGSTRLLEHGRSRVVAAIRRVACGAAIAVLVPVPSMSAIGQDSPTPTAVLHQLPPPLALWQPERTFRDVIAHMWDASPTFRQQCRRLAAAAPGLRLHVRHERGLSALGVRARSHLRLQEGTVVSAAMSLPVGGDVVELIAHELEHVLEQVDGVDLEAHLRSGVVWRHGDGYETRRAGAAGRRVAGEVAAARGAQDGR